MRKHSLILREFLTDGVMGAAFIICGIMGIVGPISLLTVIISAGAFVVEVISIILRYRKKFDVWDEAARLHYADARRVTLNIIILGLLLSGIFFLAFRFTIQINAYHIMIICGAIQVLLFSMFTFFEKREA